MAALQLPTLAPFSVLSDSSTLSQRWTKWVKSFEYFLVASNVTDKKRQRALLLHLAGPEVQEVFETLSDTGDDYATALDKLNAYFNPQKNIPFERHTFRQAAQDPSETMDAYVTRLKRLVKTCDYGTLSAEMIRDQVLEKCHSTRLRRRLLREEDLTLDVILRIARALEASDRQAKQIEDAKTSESIGEQSSAYAIQSGPRASQVASPATKSDQERQNPPPNTQHSNLVCYCCGRRGHRAKDPSCPANNKPCNGCGKLGHFSRVCKSSRRDKEPARIRQIEQREVTDSSDDEYVFTLNRPKNSEQQATVIITVHGTEIRVLIDSGASVNVLDKNTFDRLNQPNNIIKLAYSPVKLFSYGAAAPLPVLGQFVARVTTPATSGSPVSGANASFVVVATLNSGCLLGKTTATALGLLRVGPISEITLNAVNLQGKSDAIISKYPSIFNGVGRLNNYQLKVHINPDVSPVAQPPRRVPFHIRKAVDKKLKELEELDIIESVVGPTPWVSPLVAVPKANGDVRVCVDMRRANEAVIRERHPIPTLEETVQALNGATVFSKLDLRWGYHQIELHPDSRALTTFSTPQGLKRYKRLIFGLSSASEMYQFVIQQVLQGISGVRNISDDIIVFGKSQAEHDQSLHQTLQRLHAHGLTLNKEKCLFSVPELLFFGFKISAAGLAPDHKKVEAIQQAPIPANAGEVRSFLGLVNYCARFIPDFATVSEPLRQLTRTGAKWSWGTPQHLAFNKLKDSLTSDSVMAHYDPDMETELRVDASTIGLGAILMQSDGHETRPVAYASRTLTDVERRYSQTEKEALAVVWGCEKFHLYLYGTEFKLFTDHKPLEFIYSPKGKPPPRIERWALRLQPYRFKVIHMPGKTNPADVLSRLPIRAQAPRERNIAEEYINFIAERAVPKAMTLEEIAKATEDDAVLQQVLHCLSLNHWPNDPALQKFSKVRDELSTSQGLLLRGTRIVMPKSLRPRTLSLAHENHQGIVRTKQLLRQKVWWPGIDTEADKVV
jgi:hypothetical protein